MANKYKLYTEKGYLNIDTIAKNAEQINAAFIVIIGARQIGKSYGVLKYQTDNNRRFILMRRTQAEADFIAHGQISPFKPINKNIGIKKASQYHANILRPDANGNDEVIGITLALTTVSKIRGFSGEDYTDLVFDEFIPERHVQKIKNEGDAFLNAVVTISGNRELEDKPPLRTWLLANSNNLSSPILSALNLTEKIEKMSTNGQEISILPERGVVIVLPKSEEILNRRRETALLKATGAKETHFKQMAFDNKFSYNSTDNVLNFDIKEYSYITTVTDVFSLWRHKSKYLFAVTPPKTNGEFRSDELKRFSSFYPWARPAFIANRILFSSIKLKEDFKAFIKI